MQWSRAPSSCWETPPDCYPEETIGEQGKPFTRKHAQLLTPSFFGYFRNKFLGLEMPPLTPRLIIFPFWGLPLPVEAGEFQGSSEFPSSTPLSLPQSQQKTGIKTQLLYLVLKSQNKQLADLNEQCRWIDQQSKYANFSHLVCTFWGVKDEAESLLPEHIHQSRAFPQLGQCFVHLNPGPKPWTTRKPELVCPRNISPCWGNVKISRPVEEMLRNL